MVRDSSELTPKQQRFVEEYLVDFNATQAYVRAGYAGNPNTAVVSSNAGQLLRDQRISRAIAERRAALTEKVEVSAEWVLRNLMAVAQRSMTAEPVLNAEGIPTGNYTFDSRGANRALELIGKHIGFFPKEEKAGDVNVALQQVNITVVYDYQDPRR